MHATHLPYDYDYRLNIRVLRGANFFLASLQLLLLSLDLYFNLTLWPALCYLLLLSVNQYVLTSPRNYYKSAHFFLVMACGEIVLSVFLFGGLFSPALLWIPLLSLTAFFLLGRKIGLAWTAGILVSVVGAGAAVTLFGLPTTELKLPALFSAFCVILVTQTCGVAFFSILLITSRNRMVLELYNEKERQAKLLHDKRILISTISHDIANPLVAIMAFTDRSVRVLGDKNQTVEAMSARSIGYLNKLGTAAKQISNIIHNVQIIEGVADGKIRVSNVPLHLGEIFKEVVNLFESRLSEKSINLTIEIWQENIFAESHSLVHNVLANIISNAIKFSPIGGTIHLTSYAQDNWLTGIEIRDAGIGIPPAILEKIFSVHEQTSRTGTAGERGTGYGLPTVKKFVELYGGSIEVSSNINAAKGPTGTVFRLLIPTCDAGNHPSASIPLQHG